MITRRSLFSMIAPALALGSAAPQPVKTAGKYVAVYVGEGGDLHWEYPDGRREVFKAGYGEVLKVEGSPVFDGKTTAFGVIGLDLEDAFKLGLDLRK